MSADVKDFIDPKKKQPDKKPLQAGYRSFIPLSIVMSFIRGTQRENSSKPLKHSIVKRVLVFKRWIWAYFYRL